jgi:beta-propeller repeat-containing protein
MHFRPNGRAWFKQSTSVLLSFTPLSSSGLVAFKSLAQKRPPSARTEVDSNRSNQITKAASHTDAKTKGASHLVNDFGNLPLSFEANNGQAKPEVKFIARGRGYGFLLTNKEAVLLFERERKRTNGTKKTDVDALGFTLVNSNSDAALSGSMPLPGTTNYLLGNDRSKWRTNVPSFSQVKSANVYRGIDMIYRGNGDALEFDFAVAPNADPNLIKVRYRGAKQLSLTADGDLSIKLPGGTLVQHKPVAYQNIGGGTKPVTASYRLIGKTEVAFTLGSYDKNEELVIDPTLTYSTYLGGSRNDRARSVAVDASGNIYIDGETLSSDFSVSGAFQSSHFGSNAYYDTFVTKLNPSGVKDDVVKRKHNPYLTYKSGIFRTFPFNARHLLADSRD